jgi:glutamate formiminotransferase
VPTCVSCPLPSRCDVLQLTSAVLSVARCALDMVDMTQHIATHPRLGSVDHVSCHPVGPDATLEAAAQLALAIAGRLSSPPMALPVYLYGHASPCGATLAAIRRRLGVWD